MSNYKTDQCRILYRGKEFHFVSYEAQVPNPAKGEAGSPAMWYLMRAGHRYAVMPQVAGQEDPDRDRQLTEWLDLNAFVPAPPPRPAPRRRSA